MHLSTLLVASVLAVSFAAAYEQKVVCYYTNWSVYRTGKGEFNIADIDTSLCTHFIHSFLFLEGNDIVPSDPWGDLPNGGGKDGYRLFTELRKKNPSAKFLVALGGWKDSQNLKYSNMVSNRESREKFIENVVAFLKKHKFHGFDIDWEYPAREHGKPADRANFGVLLREMRKRFDQEGFLLTIAAAGPQWAASQSYDIPVISKYVDFVNLMTYDFHGTWEPKTGHHAAFRGEPSVESSVKYWLGQGMPKDKLVVGIAAYGRGWTLSNPKINGVGAYASGGSTKGPYTKEASILSYNEICEMIGKGGWSLKFDEQAQAPYAVKGDQWIGYENVKSATVKAEFIKKLGLGGAMIWTLDFDDFRGTCGEKYPILKSLNAVLRNGKPVQEEEITSAPTDDYEPEDNSEENADQAPPSGEDRGTGECTQAGNIADPNSCNYFSCVAHYPGTFIRYEMPCPPNLCFNPANGVCDWPKKGYTQ